jgi:hypothetical protein
MFFCNVETLAYFIAWKHSIIHKEKHNISVHTSPNILIDSERSFNTEVKDEENQIQSYFTLNWIFHPTMRVIHRKRIQKFFFSLFPSRIGLIRRADRTCQDKHPVIKKKTQKYLKLNPPT